MCALTMEQEQELTLVEVAERLRVSPQTVRRRIDARLIRARKEGIEWRVRASDLESYIQKTYKNGTEKEEK